MKQNLFLLALVMVSTVMSSSLQANPNWLNNSSAEIAGSTPDQAQGWALVNANSRYKRLYFSDPETGSNWAADGRYIFQIYGKPGASSLSTGIRQSVVLNQAEPWPIRLSALCSPYQIENVANEDYGQTLGYNLHYQDGTNEWSRNGPNNKLTGTFPWWYRHQFDIVPVKPVASIDVYLLIGAVGGSAQFDDVRLEQFAVRPEGAVSFVIDDGEANTLIAFSKLAQWGWVGTAGIVSDYVDSGPYYLTTQNLLDLQKGGWTFLAHSKTHRDMTRMSVLEANEEFKKSRDLLLSKGLVGSSVGFVWPLGAYTIPLIIQGESQGFRSFRTVKRGYNLLGGSRLNILIQEVNISTTIEQVRSWVLQAKDKRQWLVLTFHSIAPLGTHDDQYYTTPENFQAIVDLVHSSGISVVDYYEGLRRFSDAPPYDPAKSAVGHWDFYQ